MYGDPNNVYGIRPAIGGFIVTVQRIGIGHEEYICTSWAEVLDFLGKYGCPTHEELAAAAEAAREPSPQELFTGVMSAVLSTRTP
jgi:hypothetical protein